MKWREGPGQVLRTNEDKADPWVDSIDKNALDSFESWPHPGEPANIRCKHGMGKSAGAQYALKVRFRASSQLTSLQSLCRQCRCRISIQWG